MDNALIILVVVLVIFVTMGFIAIAFFFPEWVGIQGKVSQQIEKDHQEERAQKDKEN